MLIILIFFNQWSTFHISSFICSFKIISNEDDAYVWPFRLFSTHVNDKEMNNPTYLIFYTIIVTRPYRCMLVITSMHVCRQTTSKKTTMTAMNNNKRWLNVLLLSFHRVVIVNTCLKSLVSDRARDIVCLFFSLCFYLINTIFNKRTLIYIYTHEIRETIL